MAQERIISPGVFTNENDAPFLSTGIAQIGAAFVGPTLKGPALVPMQVTSLSDYQVKFGGEDSTQTYIPYAVKNYLKNASSALIIRILGDGGWSFNTTTNKLAAIAAVNSTGSGGTINYRIIAGLHPTKNDSDLNLDLRASYIISGSIGTSFTTVISGSTLSAITKSLSINPQSTDYITKVLGSSADATKVSSTSYGNGSAFPLINFKNYSQQLINTIGSITITSGSTVVSTSYGLTTTNISSNFNASWSNAYGYSTSYIANYATLTAAEQNSVYNSLLNGTLFTVTVPTSSLISLPNFNLSALSSSSNISEINIFPGKVDSVDYFSKLNIISGSNLLVYARNTAFVNTQLSNNTWNVQTNTNSTYWAGQVNFTAIEYPSISNTVVGTPTATVYPVVTMLTSSYNVFFPDYDHAATPWITSGKIKGVGVSSTTQNLFKIHHLSDGFSTNNDIKVTISNLREFSSGSYSTFDIVVRSFDDTDNRPNILEQFKTVSLDPDSPAYIARVIGDSYKVFDDSTNKVVQYGNYPNLSNYIRVEMDPSVDSKAVSETLSPRGFRKLKQTFIGFVNASMIPATYITSQNESNNSYIANKCLGWDYTSEDNLNYLRPIPLSGSATGLSIDSDNNDFLVDDYLMPINSGIAFTGSLSALVDITGTNGPKSNNVQFTVPLQGGTDGISYAKRRLSGGDITATNTFGYDLSTATSSGSVKYTNSFDILSNQDEYDINMLFAPGIIRKLHPYVVDYMISTAENRQDTFTIFDACLKDDNISTAIDNIKDIDSSYAATYYPWMQVLDSTINKPIWVPPSVLMPGVYSFNDAVGAEWYAPAGLQRGGINGAINVTTKLNHTERNILYQNRVNSIASFPGQGISAYAQLTLQKKASSLDSINIRRLLIAVKKFIASSSRYLVFENNTTALRNRFLSIVNPYLESVQQRNGLYSFKVVMDDTNNTAQSVARKYLIGDIYLQPTATAEFIVINFNLTPDGITVG